MNDNASIPDERFLQLVLSLQAGAVQQMGKIVSPVTGKVERNLEAARVSIDMLTMIETKMKGNLTEDESKLLGHILYELRLNYVEEAKKDDSLAEESLDQDGTKGAEGTEQKASSNVEGIETNNAEDDRSSVSTEDAGNKTEKTDS